MAACSRGRGIAITSFASATKYGNHTFQDSINREMENSENLRVSYPNRLVEFGMASGNSQKGGLGGGVSAGFSLATFLRLLRMQ